MTLRRLKSLKELRVYEAFLWVKLARVDLCVAYTQHFLPHPQLNLLPVSGLPFLSSTHTNGMHPSKAAH